MSELVGLGVTLLLAFFPFGSKGALLIKHFSPLRMRFLYIFLFLIKSLLITVHTEEFRVASYLKFINASFSVSFFNPFVWCAHC